jgi:hypothetical protein
MVGPNRLGQFYLLRSIASQNGTPLMSDIWHCAFSICADNDTLANLVAIVRGRTGLGRYAAAIALSAERAPRDITTSEDEFSVAEFLDASMSARTRNISLKVTRPARKPLTNRMSYESGEFALEQ